MKNKFIFWLIVSLLIMFIAPWMAITFIDSDAGMAVCFLLFFAINPIYSIVIGIFAGRNLKSLWEMPVVSAVLFLIGSWIFFDIGEKAFIIYALIYLILGAAAMLVSTLIHRKIKK
ncbi:hypothetical protein AALA98_07250 [Lachnospiraceae bacterium 45-W7]